MLLTTGLGMPADDMLMESHGFYPPLPDRPLAEGAASLGGLSLPLGQAVPVVVMPGAACWHPTPPIP